MIFIVPFIGLPPLSLFIDNLRVRLCLFIILISLFILNVIQSTNQKQNNQSQRRDIQDQSQRVLGQHINQQPQHDQNPEPPEGFQKYPKDPQQDREECPRPEEVLLRSYPQHIQEE